MATPPTMSLRLGDEILGRADALIPALQRDPVVQAAAPQVTRATVLRLAVLKGLALLEQESEQQQIRTSPATTRTGKAAPRRR